MTDTFDFHDLIRRVRRGDQEAAVLLVRHYEPVIRRSIRFRLINAGLASALDSADICQSVLASFFVRAAAGQYELDTPEELVKLLVTMARNKLRSQSRKEQAQCRDVRRLERGGSERELEAAQPRPDQQLIAAELLAQAYSRLGDDERQLVEMRQQGLSWDAIAAELCSTAVVLRKKMSRALDRITGELGLNES